MKRKSFVFIAILCILSSNLSMNVSAASAPELKAPSAILIEANSGNILYTKNENEPRACASITKVMTLLLVMEALENNQIKLDDILTASEHASSMGGSDIWLKTGEQMSVDDLLKATCVASANDAAVVLAEHLCTTEEAFVDKMNQKAKELGMSNTTFKNCNGLDEEGHLTTSYDVSLMSKELIKHKKIFDYTGIWLDYLRNGKTQIVSTNKMLKTYSGITGLKTGTTSQAGSCISATAQKNDLSLIAIILGCSNTTDRFNDAKLLLDYGFSNYCVYTPSINTDDLEPVQIKNGMTDKVSVTCEESKNIVVSKEDKNNIKTQININDDISAPITEGQILGSVEFKLGEKIIDKINIIALNTIEEINFSSVLDFIWKTFITI